MDIRKFKGDRAFVKAALAVAIPLMLQQLITSSVNLVDNLMVGQLGDAALGGVATTNRFYMIAIFSTFGILAAAGIFIAQYYGAKDENHMKQSFRFSILSSYVVILPFAALGLFRPDLVLSFFTDDAAIIAAGTQYISMATFSFIPMALSLSIVSAMRSIGETKIPLYVGIIAVLVNAFFNYALIFGHFGLPQLGVTGAGLATLISRIVEVSILLVVMWVKPFPFTTRLDRMFEISPKIVRNVSIKAAPLAINELMWAFGMATLFKFYAIRGPEVISGISISSTTADLFFTLFGGVAVATTVLVSQPLGANKLDEARANGYKMLGMSVVMAASFGVLMFISSFIVPNFYNVSDEARHIAQTMLRIMSFMFWIYMGTAQCYFILRAGGDTKSTLLMDSGFMWLVNIPVVAMLTYFTGFNVFALYLAGQSTDFVKLAFSYSLVKKEKWVVNLTHEPDPLVIEVLES